MPPIKGSPYKPRRQESGLQGDRRAEPLLQPGPSGAREPAAPQATPGNSASPAIGGPPDIFGSGPKAPSSKVPPWLVPAAVVAASLVLVATIVLGRNVFFGRLQPQGVPTMPPPPITDASPSTNEPSPDARQNSVKLGGFEIKLPEGWGLQSSTDRSAKFRGPDGQILEVITEFTGTRDELRPRCGQDQESGASPSSPSSAETQSSRGTSSPGPGSLSTPTQDRSAAQPSPSPSPANYRIDSRGVVLVGTMTADMEQGTLTCGFEIVQFADAIITRERIGISYRGDIQTFYSVIPTLISKSG
jgi:hypothetical protein